MKTEIEKLNLEAIDDKIIAKAAAIIRDGGLVAFPTETVYGLGADAMQASAAKKIYEAKGRPSDNPLIVHIADVSALRNLTDEVPGKAVKLAKAFWPGPLTMIVKKSAAVPYETNGGIDSGKRNLYCGTKCQYIRQTKSYDSRACHDRLKREDSFDLRRWKRRDRN